MGKGGKAPELAIKVALDPVVNKNKFEDSINKIYTEKNPLEINATIDAQKVLQSISDYQNTNKYKVPIQGKVTNTEEALSPLTEQKVELKGVTLGSDSLAAIKGQLENLFKEINPSKTSTNTSKANQIKEAATVQPPKYNKQSKPLKQTVSDTNADVTNFTVGEKALESLNGQITNGLGSIEITKFTVSPDVLAQLNEDISKGIGKISVNVTPIKKQPEVEQLSFLPQDPVESKAKKPVAKKTVITLSDEKILEMMANAQHKATNQEKAEANAAKQKAIIYQNMVDHQAKAVEVENDATSNTAKGLSDANKSMNDLNASAEKFEQNWKQIVTLIAGATKNLADLMVGSQYKGSYDKKNKEWTGGKYRNIFGGFEEFQEVEDMDSESPDKYLDPIRKWATSLSKAAAEDFDSQRMLEAIHMMSGLAEALKNVNLEELPTLYKDGNKMRDVSAKKDELISQVAQLKSIFPVSDSNDAFWGEKEDSIRYLLDLLGQAAKYYTAVGSAAKQTADSLATANMGFANQTKQLEQANAELEKAKQNTTEVKTEAPTSLLEQMAPAPQTPNYTVQKGTLDDYTQSVGAAAGLQEYFASEVDNANTSLGAQSETLKALKKSLDEYTESIDNIGKFAKVEKELERLKKAAAKQQPTQQPTQQPQTPTQQPTKQPSAPPSNPQPQQPQTPPNNPGNNGGGDDDDAGELMNDLYTILNKIAKLTNGQIDSSDKKLVTNADERVDYREKLITRAKKLMDDLDNVDKDWRSSTTWKQRAEDLSHTRKDFSTARADKADLADEKQRIKDEEDYILLLKQETKAHQDALAAQRKYGDKDFRTQFAMDDWQQTNSNLKAMESVMKKQHGGVLSNIPDYDDAVEKNRRSWMQWGQDQQDISAKQRVADLKDNTSLLNNYNKALETQAKLLQGLYKIDQSKDPGGYAAKQIALQSNAINVANLRKDIKSHGLENESAYSDANAKYLAGINAANLTKAQKAQNAADKFQADIAGQQDEWLKKTTDNINTAKKEYISAFKEIQDLQQKLLQTNDQALQTDLKQQIQDQRTIMKDRKKELNSYLRTPLVNGLAQNAFDEIHAVKTSYAQDASLQNEQNTIDDIVQNCKELNTLYKTRQSMFKPEDTKNLADVDQKIQDLEQHVQDLVVTSEQAGVFVTNSADVANALNKSGEKKFQTETTFNTNKQSYDINAAKNSYIQNFKKKRENEDLLNRVDQNDPDRIQKLQRYTQWIQENETAIQNAKQILNSYHAAANEAWKEIQQLVDSTSTKDIEAKNAEAEAAKKKAESDAKKAAADARKQASEDASYFSQLNQAVNNKLRTYKAFLEADRKDPTKKSKEYLAARGNFNDADNAFAELVQEGYNSGRNTDSRFDNATDRHNRNIDAIAEANTKRAQAEAEAVKVTESDIDAVKNLDETLDKIKNRLRAAGATDSKTYADTITSQEKLQDLRSRLESELQKPGSNKNTIAVTWANENNIDNVKSMDEVVKRLTADFKSLNSEAGDFSADKSLRASITKNRTELANLQSQLYDYLKKFPSVESEMSDSVMKLRQAMNVPNADNNIGKLKQDFAELRHEAKELGLETESLVDKFKNLFGQHLSTMITMAALHKMQDALRVVYQNVVEIDTALTELKKVSELSGQALSDYMDRAAESAQKLGVSISDYISSTADWKRLGYSDEDAENMATYSTLLKNVGD